MRVIPILCWLLLRINEADSAGFELSDESVLSFVSDIDSTSAPISDVTSDSSDIASFKFNILGTDNPKDTDNSVSHDDFELANCSGSSQSASVLTRRQKCGITRFPWRRGKPDNPDKPWRAPARLPAPNPQPNKAFDVESPDGKNRCTRDPLKTLFLACSGPEVWYTDKANSEELGYVLNCFPGLNSNPIETPSSFVMLILRDRPFRF